MLRSLSISTPTRHQRDPSPRLQRTSSVGSSNSVRPSSSPSFLRRLSSPQFFKKTTPSKEKISPQLQRALDHLKLRDLDALETHFLKLPAFLEPWTDYRDTFLLLQPNGMPRSALPGQLARTDILHYYTFFLENKLRYDGSADPCNEKEYNPSMTEYHVIDKTRWGAAEYEKLLYAWLLQTFKVGKHINPRGIDYFERLNICTAWEEVFWPIVEAVRNDYNAKGRYHYGRLAKFIEEVSPSRLAFPEGNVSTEKQFLRRSVRESDTPPHTSAGDVHPVTGLARNWKKPWHDDEVELRQAYPQYGALIERPKPKVSFQDWIAGQRAKMQRRREEEAAVERTIALELLEGSSNISSGFMETHQTQTQAEAVAERPFIKRLREAQETRTRSPVAYKPYQRDVSAQSSLSIGTNSPVRMNSTRKSSDGVYSAIRSSNPHLEDPRLIYGHPSERNISSTSHQRSATMAVETKPSPLERPFNTQQHKQAKATGPTHNDNEDRKPSYEGSDYLNYEGTGRPSYEGSGYTPPWMPTLKEVNSSETISNLKLSKPSEKARTRIPSPIEIPINETTRKYHPVVDRIPNPIEIPVNETTRKYHPAVESAVVRAEATPMTVGPPPPVPSKNPKRYSDESAAAQSQRRIQRAQENNGNLLGKIVSIENIRAALDTSSEASDEDVKDHGPADHSSPASAGTGAFAGIGGRGLNTGESPKLQAFSSHLFPRVGCLSRNQTPVGTPDRRYGSNGSNGQYERKTLRRDVADEHSGAFL